MVAGDFASDDGLSAFVRARPRLFGIAYRVLGSVAEAEDVVQEVWLRWQNVVRDEVREPAAFLATAATRLAINRVRTASARREVYVGVQLPEPIDASADPAVCAERSHTLEVAGLKLLETLSPLERAAYVLREAFSYEYAKIAELIRVSEVHCRQLVTRARKHIAEGRRALGAGA